MISLMNLTPEQVGLTIEHGEFGTDVIAAQRNVAVIMTQSWCLQWVLMRRWLEKEAQAGREDPTDEEPPIAVFIVIYDAEPYFREFLEFKEERFGNAQVPYLRFYRDGRLVYESNYLSKKRFLGVFDFEGKHDAGITQARKQGG